MKKVRYFSLIITSLVLFRAGSSLAASTGFNQTAAGPWDYNTSGNWVGATINGLWDTSLTNTANQTVTFAADTSLGTGLIFNYAGNYSVTFKALASGTNTITLGGDIIMGTNGSSANVTIGDSANHVNVDLGGVNRTNFVKSSRTLTFLDIVSNGSVTKRGYGGLTFKSSSVNTFAGGLTAYSGVVLLDFSNLSTPIDLLNNGNSLVLAGGQLIVQGKNNAASIQTLGNPTFNTGGSTIAVTNGTGSTASLTLGNAWTQTTGGVVNIQLGASGSVTSSPSLFNGIIGPWASFGSGASTKYATVSGGVVAGLTGTVAADASALTDSGSTVNYDLALATGTVPATMSANTIRFTGSANTTAPGTTLFSVNGLMNAGSGLWTIGTGALTIGSDKDLVVNAANNSITISSPIINNGGGASSLTKTGSQTLTLSAASTFSGGITLNAGRLSLNHNSALGSGTLTINGGEIYDAISFTPTTNIPIVLNGNFTHPDTARDLNLGTGSVTLNVPISITTAHGTVFGGIVSGPGSLNAFDMTVGAGSSGGRNIRFGAAITLRSNQTVIPGEGSLIASAAVSGGTMIISGGQGGVSLKSANHTFTGEITIEAGCTLQNEGNLTTTGITINPGGTLVLGVQNLGNTGSISSGATLVNNGTFKLGDNTAYVQGTQFPSVISGVGSVEMSGTRVNYVTLNGVNTYSGGTKVIYTGGGGPVTLNINSANAIGTGSLTLSQSGANPATINNTSGGAVTLATDNVQYWNGPITFTGTQSLNLGNGAVTLGASPTVTITANTLTVGGAISGGYGITKAGNGTLVLSGTSTYTGNTTLTAGILNINNDNNLGSVGTLTFNAGTLQFAAASTVTIARQVVLNSGTTSSVDTSLAAGTIEGPISGSGNLTKTGGNSLTLTGVNTFTGNLTISGGTVKLGSGTVLQNSIYVTTGSTGGIGLDMNGFTTLVLGGLSGAVDLATAITGYNGVTALTLNPLSGSFTYTGVITNGSDGMTLTKSGAGTQVLSGINTYTGATAVNGGILLINSPGSLHASSAVGVSAGAIGGTGTINGSLTLSGTGGIDLRGDVTTGTLTLGSTLAITGASGVNNIYFDLGNNTAFTDKIAVTGTVTISNPVTIVLNQIGLPNRATAGTYDLLATSSGTLALANYTLFTTKAYGQTFSLALDGTSQKLQLTTTRVTASTAAAFWSGATDDNWSNGNNWNTTVGGGVISGVPDYQANVSFYTTTPAATRLSSNVLDTDFDINSLNFLTSATSPVTIGGSTKTLTIEATNANGNTAGNGITVGTPSSGTVIHAINANVGLGANQTWTVNTNATLTLSGNLTDFGGGRTLTKKAIGTLNLDGDTTVGSLYVGFNSASCGYVVAGVSGSLSVGSGSASSLLIGVNGTVAGNTDVNVLDVSAANFVANVGNCFVGVCATALSSPQTARGILKLGNSTITAQNFVIGGVEPDGNSGANNGGVVTIASGSTVNILTPVLAIGTTKSNAGGSLQMLGTGTFNLGTGNSRTALYIGRHLLPQTGNPETGNMDLSTGTANMYLSGLCIAKNINGTASGSSTTTGTLTLSGDASNNLNINGPGNVVQIGYYDGLSGFTVSGTLTIGNLGVNSAITSTDNSTAILIGYKPSGTCSGILNLYGGVVTITTTGMAIAGGGGTSRLCLSSNITLKAGASSTNWISGLTTATNNNAIFDTAGFNISIAQPFSGTGTLTKAGSGILTLSGTNSYTDKTIINAGTLNAGAVETENVSGPFGKQLASATGTLLFGGGTLQYSTVNSNDYSGRFGTVGGQPISIDLNGQVVTFATAIQGAGTSLTVANSSGIGKLFLTGANSFTGPLTFSSGTLGGFYGSSGGGVMTNGATLSPGTNSIGTFAHSGDATLETTSTLVIELADYSNDKLSIGGALNLGGAVTFVTNSTSPLALASYVVITNADARTGEFALTNGLPSGYGVVYEANCVRLVQTNNAPIMAVLGTNGILVATGSSMPTLALGTDFGYGGFGTAVTNTFVVTNNGTGSLTLTNTPAVLLTGDASFTVNPQPGVTTISAGSSTTFTVVFTTPSDNSWRTGMVTIANNDITHDPYTFALRGGPYNGRWIADSTGNWNDATKWQNASIAQGATFTAAFVTDITAPRTVTNDVANRTIGRLIFSDTSPDNDWTLGGSPLLLDNLGAGSSITVSNQTATVSCVITGAERVIKSGSGTLVLSNTNTYSGGTTINAGSLAVGHNLALGTNVVTMAGGTLSAATGSFTITNKINLANNGLFDPAGNSLILGGAVTNTGALIINGAGTVTLSGTNTYSGGTVISNGLLCLGVAKGISNNTPVTINGGALDLNGKALSINPLSGTGGVITNSGTGLTLTNSVTTTYAGNITGSGSLTKYGTATLNLNGNTTLGGLSIAYAPGGNATADYGTIAVGSGGVMSIGIDSSCSIYIGVGTGSGNGGQIIGTVDASAASSFVANVGNFKIGGTVGGVGYLYLGTNNTITAATEFGVCHGNWGFPNGYGTVTTAAGGSTTIHTPVLYIGHNTPNGTTGGWGRFTLGNGATLNVDGLSNGRASMWIAVVNSQGPTGASYMDLSGAGTGVANLKLGYLLVSQLQGGSPANASGSLTLSASSLNHVDISGPGNVVLVGDNGGGSASDGSIIIGNLDSTSSITSTDNNTAILLASKRSTGTPTGTLTVNGGTLTITTAGSAIAGGGGSSTLSLKDCTLIAGSSSTNWIQGLTTATMTNTVTFGTGTNNITIPQVLSGMGSLIKSGTGTLSLSGVNTYSGGTTINGGTLKLASTGSINNSTNITIMAGGTLDVTNVASYVMSSANTYTVGLTNSLVGTINAGALDITSAKVVLSGVLTNGGAYVLATYTSLTGSGFTYTNGSFDIDYDYLGSKQIVLIQASPNAPFVKNTGVVTNLVNGTCNLQGILTNGGFADIWLCWGAADGGTSTGGWNNVVAMGQLSQGVSFSTVASGLSTNVTYWYRCYASNQFGTGWSTPATSFSCPPVSAAGGGSGYKMKITFTNFEGMGTLSNFPALVKLTTNNTVNYTGFINTNGYELRFWTNSSLTGSELNYEIEQFNNTTTSFIWVQIPFLTNNASIWASWGDASATNQEAYTTNGATWSEGFASVWHVSEGSGNRIDSKSRYVGTPTSINATNGIIAGGINLNGSSSKLVTTYGQPSVTSYTAMAWINTTAGGNAVILQDRGSGSGKSLSLGIGKNSAGKLWYALDSDSILRGVQDGAAVNNGVWHHVVGVWSAPSGVSVNDSAQFKIYADGVLCTGTSGLNTGASTSPLLGAGASAIGYHQAWNVYFPGGLDEVSASTVVRGSNWIWACWMNQGVNHDSFMQYDAPVVGTVIQNLAPAGVTNTAATLNAMLSAGSTNYDVYVHFGPTDGTTNFGSWAASYYVGSWTNVVTTNISYLKTSLSIGSTNYYTFRATNANTNVWATPSWMFVTPLSSNPNYPYNWSFDQSNIVLQVDGGNTAVIYSVYGINSNMTNPSTLLYQVSNTTAFIYINTNALGSVDRKFYRVTETVLGVESTNALIYTAFCKALDTNAWYKFALGIDYGTANRLNSTLGSQLAQGLYGSGTKSLADLFYLLDSSGNWAMCYLNGSGTWYDYNSDNATNTQVLPWQSFWIKRRNSGSTTYPVYSGYCFTNAAPLTFRSNDWHMITWPLPLDRKEGDGAPQGWGFAAAGGKQGTSWLNSDILTVGDGAALRFYYLNTNGRWCPIGSTTPASGLPFHLGEAYYYMHRGTGFTWTASEP